MSSLEIAKKAKLKPIVEIARKIGLTEDDIELYGKYKAKVKLEVYEKNRDKPDGKLIVVTAVTPTKAGEGKTTVAIGLGEALGRLNLKNIVVLRQPSLGPVFGIKGGATGGGYAQVLPMEDINIHFTGDLHAVTVAHDLLNAVLDNHIYRGYEPKIDIHNIYIKRVLDMEDRPLRHIVIGLGGRTGGIPRETGFEITTACETAAIHALATSLRDLKERLGNITVALSTDRKPVKAKDLKCVGAMTVVMKDSIKPNLVQTLEGTPAFVHGGPFANVGHGCPSLMAIKIALKLADYVVVEPGFGADLGFEKFCDIACRAGNIKPDVAVIVASIKALRSHGGAKEHDNPNLEAVKKGIENLEKQIENVEKFGVPAVVAINKFQNDADEEIKFVKEWCEKKGVPVAVVEVFQKGGEGGIELARKVLEVLETRKADFKFLYDLKLPVEEKIKIIAKEMYGADDVIFTDEAKRDIRRIKRMKVADLPINMAKTPLSLTDDPKKVGRPRGFKITITNVKPFTGAGFLVAYCGEINTLPALPSKPAVWNIDLDVETGEVIGLR
ncbi:MAG: formate--tetrahydrofolate ligase [Candidatus Verstraetearchaeota archaeon]|nr:formate--tetrahydrofolate ligase [Candidatus Verstraetearchaeota archaeon]